MFFSRSIIVVIKSGWRRLAGHVECMPEKRYCMLTFFWWGKMEERDHLEDLVPVLARV
jgi:hypothetical protein